VSKIFDAVLMLWFRPMGEQMIGERRDECTRAREIVRETGKFFVVYVLDEVNTKCKRFAWVL